MNKAHHTVVLLLLAGLTARSAESWPMFRGGPTLSGASSSRLPGGLKLLWSFKTAGPVKSSAAIAGGRVVIGSNDSNIYALDFANGKKQWAFKTGGDVESSPLVLDGKVFAGSADNFLYALEARSGKLLWRYETGDKILGSANWVKSAGATLILIGSYDFKRHFADRADRNRVSTHASR